MAGVELGMSQQDVRDRLGLPISNQEAPTIWLYTHGGNRLKLIFDPDQRVSEAICDEGEIAERPCVNILGVEINTSEAALKLRLGPPDQENYQNGDKILSYRGLGSVFRLRQSRVVAIDERGAGSIIDRLQETFWELLP